MTMATIFTQHDDDSPEFKATKDAVEVAMQEAIKLSRAIAPPEFAEGHGIEANAVGIVLQMAIRGPGDSCPDCSTLGAARALGTHIFRVAHLKAGAPGANLALLTQEAVHAMVNEINKNVLAMPTDEDSIN